MTDFRALCVELHAAFTTYAVDECHHNLLERARAALAEHESGIPKNCWLDKAELKSALAKPEPEGPTVMQLIELSYEIEDAGLGQVDLVRAALARWGHLAPQPVPVSERLPGPEDCDAEGRCWVWWKNGVRWVLDEWTHHELREGPLSDYVSHWLPAHAIPIPTAND